MVGIVDLQLTIFVKDKMKSPFLILRFSGHKDKSRMNEINKNVTLTAATRLIQRPSASWGPELCRSS